MNDKDMRKVKVESFELNNFDQIENFCEYEAYVKASYNQKVVRELNQMYEIIRS